MVLIWDFRLQKKTMIVGVDVYHSPAGQKRTSVVGFVASTDANFTKWYSKACFQNPHQEMIDVLKACLINAVKAFKQVKWNLVKLLMLLMVVHKIATWHFEGVRIHVAKLKTIRRVMMGPIIKFMTNNENTIFINNFKCYCKKKRQNFLWN